MKIQNLKTKVIGPVLLLIPMACMHLGDGQPSGHGHYSGLHPSYQYSTSQTITGAIIGREGVTSNQSMMADKIELMTED